MHDWLADQARGDTKHIGARAFEDVAEYRRHQRWRWDIDRLDPSDDPTTFVADCRALAENIDLEPSFGSTTSSYIGRLTDDVAARWARLEAEGLTGDDLQERIKSDLRPSAVLGAIRARFAQDLPALTEDGDRLAQSIGFIAEARFNEANAWKQTKGEYIHPRIDDVDAKIEVRQAAGRYADLTWAHCEKFTNQAILAVLDTELIPLEREAKDPVLFLPDPLKIHFDKDGWKVQAGLMVLGVAIVGGLAAWFFSKDWEIAGWLAVAYLVWSLWSWGRSNRTAAKAAHDAVSKVRAIAGNLRRIRDEVQSGSYSATRLRDRLIALEADGCDVPSVVYRLLDLEIARTAPAGERTPEKPVTASAVKA